MDGTYGFVFSGAFGIGIGVFTLKSGQVGALRAGLFFAGVARFWTPGRRNLDEAPATSSAPPYRASINLGSS